MFVFFQMMVLLPFLILKIEESHFALLLQMTLLGLNSCMMHIFQCLDSLDMKKADVN